MVVVVVVTQQQQQVVGRVVRGRGCGGVTGRTGAAAGAGVAVAAGSGVTGAAGMSAGVYVVGLLVVGRLTRNSCLIAAMVPSLLLLLLCLCLCWLTQPDLCNHQPGTSHVVMRHEHAHPAVVSTHSTSCCHHTLLPPSSLRCACACVHTGAVVAGSGQESAAETATGAQGV